jgi:outer membrane protein OmpA-like peptidoglycan-associated protein
MKKILILVSATVFLCKNSQAQQNTAADGDWAKQLVILKNTPEADLMIRVGDIDNLGFGWSEGFIPFSGRSTESHGFPWEPVAEDAPGTDRIFVPGSFKYENPEAMDGYTSSTQRPANKPVPIRLPLSALKGTEVSGAVLQLFVDDFQSPALNSKFRFSINGKRFVEAEKLVNGINQTGPIGKLLNIRFTGEFLELLKPDSTLVISIDDPTTGAGDGFSIDFAKLLINPKVFMYKGTVKGKILDADTKKPIANATAEVKEYGTALTNNKGEFVLNDIPAGLDLVTGSAPGYSSDQKQVDVISGENTEEVELELKRSGKIKYNEKILQEGDKLVMNNIQFELNSAELLAEGRRELDKLASLMKDNPSIEILLAGFTSSEGAAAANKLLSLKRVSSCKNYLASKGIDEGRISIRGYGPEKPIAPNDTESNRAKNRRVEMQVTKI